MEALATERDLTQASLEAFEEVRSRPQAPWLARLREEAFGRFSELGIPTARLEEWKYTSAGPIARIPFAISPAGSKRPTSADALLASRLPGSIELTFVNGRFSEELSVSPTHPGGVTVESLARALRNGGESIRPDLARLAGRGENAFAALNTALFEDGALVRLAPGTVLRQPIHVLFVSDPGPSPTASHSRILIVAGEQSEATVVETYMGVGGPAAPSWTNSVTEILCGDGAILEHVKLQQEELSAYHVHTIQVEQGRSSRFTSHNVALGSALARTDLSVRLAAEGADCVLNGLFLGRGTQHVDNHTTIDHATPHGTSRELYKGILDGKSRGVFYGKILVRQDAQKTDAMQTNRNLLLSREALVNSTPALEILADDVKCRHGSTIGQLDENALFYLRSRGLGERDARALLLYAFAADVTGRIRVAPIRDRVEAFLGQSLVPGPEGA